MALDWVTTFDAIVREHIEPTVVDNFFRETPVMTELRQTAKPVTGDEIHELIEHTGPTASWVADEVTNLTASRVEEVTRAVYPWRHAEVDARISKFKINAARGPEAVADQIRIKTQSCINALRMAVSTSIFTDQTGNEILGLTDICDNVCDTEFGGIVPDVSDNKAGEMPQWVAHVMEDDADSNGYVAPSIANLKKMVRYITDTCGEKPHLIVVHPEYYNVVEAQVSENDRLAGIRNANVVQMGFDAIGINGVPLVSDLDCTGSAYSSGSRADGYEAFFINWNYCGLRYEAVQSFKFNGWKEPTDANDIINFLWLHGNLVCSQRRAMGRMFNVNIAMAQSDWQDGTVVRPSAT